MASYSSAFSSGWATLFLTVTEQSYSIPNNTSYLKCVLEIRKDISSSTTSYNNGGANITMTANGTSLYSATSFDIRSMAKGARKTLATKYITINHNSDGSKSINVAANFASGVSLGTASISKTYACRTIPRATTPTLSASSVNVGSSVTINTPRASSSFTHRLFYKIGSGSWVSIATGVGTSYSWTVPKSIANSFPNNSSGVIVIAADTYNGSTKIGSKQVNLTVNVPTTAEFMPAVSSLTVSESVSKVTAAFGSRYVQGLSQLNVKATATGSYNSTIKSYSTSVDGVKYSSAAFTSNVINGVGTIPVTVTITDSRNRTATKTINVSVIAYSSPTITAMSYQQCNADGTANNEGTSTKVVISGKVASVDSQNSITLILKWKKSTETTYQTRVLSTSGWEFAVETIINDTAIDETYEFVAVLTDKIKTVEKEVTTGTVALSFLAGGNGVAIGKEAEKAGACDIAYKLYAPNIYLNAHGVTAQIGPQSSNYMYFVCAVPFYFNNEVQIRGALNPYTNETYDMGTKSKRWKYVYAKGLSAANGDGVWLTDTTGKEYKSLYVATDDGSYFQGPGTMYFRSNLNSSSYQGHWLRLFREQSGSYRTIFRPNVNSTAYLGTTSERWNTAFFTNAITASDLKEKDVIEDFDFKTEEFILGLKPIAYRRKGEGDGGKRIHLGFGAQDVAKTIDDLEMGNLSMVQASVVEEGSVERENDNGKVETVIERVEKPYDGGSVDDSKLSWGLNYNELIAPMVLMIQKQEERIKKLEEYIAKLGNHVDKTEEV